MVAIMSVLYDILHFMATPRSSWTSRIIIMLLIAHAIVQAKIGTYLRSVKQYNCSVAVNVQNKSFLPRYHIGVFDAKVIPSPRRARVCLARASEVSGTFTCVITLKVSGYRIAASEMKANARGNIVHSTRSTLAAVCCTIYTCHHSSNPILVVHCVYDWENSLYMLLVSITGAAIVVMPRRVRGQARGLIPSADVVE